MTIKPEIHYQVLEIEFSASQNEIKQAYRDLAKVWHPDRFADDPRLQQKAEEKLKRINAAYEFLKSYQPQANEDEVKAEPEPERAQSEPEPSLVFLNCERLEKLLESGRLKDADQETKRLLLQVAGREQEGWLRPDDVRGLPPQALSVIDQLWIKYSHGRFGFSAQSKIWRKLDCTSSASISTQTMSEKKFGQSVSWLKGSTWLTPWDSFHYDIGAPQGSLPKEYIFVLNGWWSYSKGWTGYLLWRFDEIFTKV